MNGRSVFDSRNHRLGKVIAAAISFFVTFFCIIFGIIGSFVLMNSAKEIEASRQLIKSESWVLQIVESAFLENWAFIEGNIKPVVSEQDSISLFLVTDPSNKIVISSNEELIDKDISFLSSFVASSREISKVQKNIRAGSKLTIETATSEFLLSKDLSKSSSEFPTKAGSPMLMLKFDVRQDSGPVCTIAFGYNIGPIIQSLNRARNIILVAALVTAAILGIATLLITTRILKPLEDISERLSAFANTDAPFDENLGQFDLSGIKANSREVVNLLNAFAAFKEELKSNITELSELRTTAAVAQTTQMLAHDLRKPFSLLKIAINMLSKAKDPEAVEKTLAKVIPQVDRAMSGVNSMLSDLLEIGTKAESIDKVTTKVTSTVEMATYESFMLFPKADISLSCEFKHTKCLNVDNIKIQRVFTNIIHNAIQAMKLRGRIWIKTRDTNDGFIEFIVGNSGSYIPEETIPRLFEMFFTQNKRGGTGLGLAITRKIITAHGGQISCSSTKGPTPEDSLVEFCFTLPCADVFESPSSVNIPSHSALFMTNIKDIMSQGETEALLDDPIAIGEALVETELVNTVTKLDRKLAIAIVDDESIYQQYVVNMVLKTPDLAQVVNIDLQSSPGESLSQMKKTNYDLVISDIDFGPDVDDGYQFVKQIRSANGIIQPLICMHSNRISSTDHRTAVESGADAFLPKPMPRSHLLKLLLQAARHAEAQRIG